MTNNTKPLRITITMRADDSVLYKILSATSPYRRGRCLLRLAHIGMLFEAGQIRLGNETMQEPAPMTAQLLNPTSHSQQEQEIGESRLDGPAINPIDLDLSDLWSSSMLKV